MKHPLHRFGKKNRNIISGILVGIASIYAVASFFDVPQSQINIIFMSAALLVLGIMLLAVIAIVLIKGLGKIIRLISNPRHK